MPADVFAAMPTPMLDSFAYFDRPASQAVFLMGALPVLAGALSPGVEITHADGPVSPDIYTCVVAPPASGKGSLKWARRLGSVIDQRLFDRSEAARMDWAALGPDDRRGAPQPPERSFYLAANSSAAAFTEALASNGGRGVVFEEEIDTLAGALGQDWGNFSDVLRKCSHHEPVTQKRKNERLRIESPALSMALSGTLEQFLKLFKSAENGLFSRYLFFAFRDYEGWRSHRPRVNDAERAAHFDGLARDLADLHDDLVLRPHRLRVRLTTDQWDRHDDFYTHAERSVVFGRPESGVPPLPQRLVANVRRGGLSTVRVAATLSCIRAWADAGRFPGALPFDSLTVHDDDLDAALHLSNVTLEHALQVYGALEQTGVPSSRSVERATTAFDALPARFCRADMEAAASAVGVSFRTVTAYRDEWIDSGLVEKVGWGEYAKVESGDGSPADAAPP